MGRKRKKAPANDDRRLTVRFTAAAQRRGQSVSVVESPEPAPKKTPSKERVPRIAQLLALAHHFQDLLDRGEVKSMAELARLAGVSRPRITQIMNLTLLAPEIQEEILHLPATTSGHDPITERHTRTTLTTPLWHQQYVGGSAHAGTPHAGG